MFFTDVEASIGDWLEAEKIIVEDIRAAMDSWASDDPGRVVARLSELKAELAYTQRSWPDRPLIAGQAGRNSC